MASVLYQSIETLSRDKGIEPAVVVGAVEDAIALATRKYYKTQENMRAEMDRETGDFKVYELLIPERLEAFAEFSKRFGAPAPIAFEPFSDDVQRRRLARA